MSRREQIEAASRDSAVIHAVLWAVEHGDMPWVDAMELAVLELAKQNEMAIDTELRRPRPTIIVEGRLMGRSQ